MLGKERTTLACRRDIIAIFTGFKAILSSYKWETWQDIRTCQSKKIGLKSCRGTITTATEKSLCAIPRSAEERERLE